MMAWHDVAPADSFENDVPAIVEVGETRVAVFRIDGAFFAISDICTHAFALLSEGFCEHGTVECPLHQARFDIRTGKALDEPAEIDLPTYPTRVESGMVQVDIEG